MSIGEKAVPCSQPCRCQHSQLTRCTIYASCKLSLYVQAAQVCAQRSRADESEQQQTCIEACQICRERNRMEALAQKSHHKKTWCPTVQTFFVDAYHHCVYFCMFTQVMTQDTSRGHDNMRHLLCPHNHCHNMSTAIRNVVKHCLQMRKLMLGCQQVSPSQHLSWLCIQDVLNWCQVSLKFLLASKHTDMSKTMWYPQQITLFLPGLRYPNMWEVKNSRHHLLPRLQTSNLHTYMSGIGAVEQA